MADVIGVISGGMGIYSFIESLLPSAESLKTTVRVSAGKISETAGGKVAEIRLYDDAGSIVGKNEGGGVDRGSFTDISISQSTGQQATWVELRGDDDAICIPYISVTWADGSTYGWMGDVAKECGMDWYEGGVYVDNGRYQPPCAWIDANHDNDLKTGAISVHLPSFVKPKEGEDYSKNPQDYCGEGKLRGYRNSDATDPYVKKRGPVRRSPFDSLVVSDIATANATQLCESETSWGPDFVATSEGVYCDMQTRETLPICGPGAEKGCFDLASNTMQKRDGSKIHKRYSSIDHWKEEF